MSAFGVAITRGIASLGGPQVAAVLVIGGLVAGSVGGVVLGSAGSRGQPATTSGRLAVYPCPDQGPALTTIEGGQRLLATGRTQDGSWLRIHYPAPGRTEAWVQAPPLTISGSLDALPVATCQSELAIGSPDVGPSESLTAFGSAPPPSPSPSPSLAPTASPTTRPTGTPNARPALTSLTTSTRTVSYDQASYCPNAPKTVTFNVKAADASGVAGVTLSWRAPGATAYTRSEMTRTAGSAKNGTWQLTLDSKANRLTRAGKLAFYTVARDSAGATDRLPVSGANTVTVAVCSNTGPAITGIGSSSGSSLSWDPLNVGSCQTATNITATVKDVDGVTSVTLFFRRPGGTWDSKPMDNQTIPGKWYANLDTLGDEISIASPPTDGLGWYIKAVDGKNLASQSSTRSLTIRRCDSEATFDGVFPTAGPGGGQAYTYACATTTLAIGTYANDPDQPNDGLKVVFHWSLRNPRTGDGPISGQMSWNYSNSNYYQGTTKSFNGKTFYAGVLSVYAVTTDRYGGTTTSSTSTYGMQCVSP